MVDMYGWVYLCVYIQIVIGLCVHSYVGVSATGLCVRMGRRECIECVFGGFGGPV